MLGGADGGGRWELGRWDTADRSSFCLCIIPYAYIELYSLYCIVVGLDSVASRLRRRAALLWAAVVRAMTEFSTLCFAQILHMDWARVGVSEDGHAAAFGPIVDVGEDTLHLSAMTGYFANSDGFYGRPHWTEYIFIHHDPQEERIQALKVVGDANVPRGQLTWRSAPGQASHPTQVMHVQLRLRDEPTDPDGFEWSPGDHEIEWEPAASSCSSGGDDDADGRIHCGFWLLGPNPAGEQSAYFRRVDKATALEAARTLGDAA